MKILPILMSLAGVLIFSAGAAEIPPSLLRPWAIGDVIDVDIVTPLALDVFQPDQTQVLREREEPRIPPVFRDDSTASPAAEIELRRQFTAAREQFVALIEAAFQRRTLQAVAELSDPRFFEAMTVLGSRQPGFPLSTNLAEVWALGDGGVIVLDDLANQLRRFMTARIRADQLPDGEQLTAPTILLLPPDTPRAEVRSPDSVATSPNASRGVSLPQANLFALNRYRRDLVELAPDGDKQTIRFLAGFLRPNCVFDQDATALARTRRIQDLNVVDHLAAGEVLARRGERVDARLKRSLDALRAQQQAWAATGSAARLEAELERAQTEATRLQSRVEAERVQAAQTVTAVRRDIDASEQRNHRLRIGVASVSGVCLLFAGLWWRRRRRQRQLERSANWAVIPAGLSGDEADLWRERALAAEARADKATALLRTRLLPHMARWMMTELVQRLLLHRTAAQTSQQRAELEVAELAERLEKLHAPLEERRRAYEQRIQELEAELAARDRQDHALIQARIESTRRRLQADHETEPFAS